MYPSLGTPDLHAFQFAYNFNSAVTFFILYNTLDVPLPANTVVTVPCLLTQGLKFLACCVYPDKKLYGNYLYWLNILYWNFLHLALEKSLPWNCPLYWIYFLPFRIFEQFALALKHRVCPENFHCIEYTFWFRIFEQHALALKKQSMPWIHYIEYIFFIIQDFWATCDCHENRVCSEFIVLDVYFVSFKIFEQLALALQNTSCPDIFTVLKYFYHSGFLSNLRLPWKQGLPWIHCIEYIFFIIQDFWANCACPEKHELPWYFSLYWNIFIIQDFWATWVCPENRVCPEFTVLNIYFLTFRIFEQLALALKTEFALKFFRTGGGRPPRPPPRTPMSKGYKHHPA